jgi:N-acyl-D-amino-acid deacylase
VLGNCGVGFAPVRPSEREWLIQLMEGVEDIPGTALSEGIRWEWESFPEYLDAIERTPRAADIAAQIPHGALRSYVMGKRGADDERATPGDVSTMADLVRSAIAAGAVGFSTNRLPSHTAKDGRPVPGTTAGEDELFAIGQAMSEAGGGVFQVVSAEGMGLVPGGYQHDVDWLSRLSLETGLPTTIAVTQNAVSPDQWRDVLGWIDDANARGAHVVPQCSGRPLGLLIGLATRFPFESSPAYQEVAALPLPQRAEALADPVRRSRILADAASGGDGLATLIRMMPDKLFPLYDPPDYEPAADTSLGAVAARSGQTFDEVLYDLMLEDGGRRLVLFTLGGYAYHHADHIVEMFEHPTMMLGLADGGAHCSLICDASVYTSVMSYWTRDRTRGRRIPLEVAVKKMTSGPAALYGFTDRGIIAPGYRADLNVMDRERLRLRLPEVANDLPTGASRVVQSAVGYVMTMLNGVAVTEHDEDTGARPGGLVRGKAALAHR